MPHGPRRLPENLGELSGSASTQDIHLKETILRMNKAGCIGNIFSIFAANRGYTQRVAFHFHRRVAFTSTGAPSPATSKFPSKVGRLAESAAQTSPRTAAINKTNRGVKNAGLVVPSL